MSRREASLRGADLAEVEELEYFDAQDGRAVEERGELGGLAELASGSKRNGQRKVDGRRSRERVSPVRRVVQE
jgi:hypothetical protein